VNRDDAVLALRADARRIDRIGEGEAARESAMQTLDAMELLALLLLLLLRSPLMVSIPSSKVTCTSSFLTAGSCAFSRYSVSVSLMSTVGDHSTAPSPSPLERGQRLNTLGILANMSSRLANGSQRTRLMALSSIFLDSERT